MKKIPGLTFTEALNVTLKDKKNAVITVGIIQDDFLHLPSMEKRGGASA
jgi:hypothetical protein